MANKNSTAKKLDLSVLKKFNFAKFKRFKGVQIVSKIAIYFVLICIGFIFLEPILEMLSKSIMQAKDLIDPSITWIAKHATFDNFKNAAATLSVPGSLLNSVWFSALLAICQTAVSATTAFAMSRYTFKGRNFWFMMLIIAFIIPIPLVTIPRIIVFKLINTVIPQILMSVLGQGAYSTMLILIFYNFFNMIPKSLDEAAMIDGAGSLKVFYHVAIRLSISTILVVFLFSFVFNWNETYTTNLMTGDSLTLLPGKLAMFDNGMASAGNSVNEANRMAATLIAIAPLLLLYACVQKQFIEGIENTGITGE